MTAGEAVALVEPVSKGSRHWPILRSLLHASATAGNLTSDAQVATLASEHGATICAAEYDFKRFPGVEQVNPLDENASRAG